MEEETKNFSSLVKKRIVVREFKEPRTGKFDPDIKEIASNGVKIPTAGFSRGIEVLTILDHDNIKKIAVITNEKKYTSKGLDPWISWAEGIIIILINKNAYIERYGKEDKNSSLNIDNWHMPYWYIDAGAALMNILLGAEDKELGSGFLGGHNIHLNNLKSEFKIPKEIEVLGLVPIGVRKHNNRKNTTEKKKLIHTEVYGK
jgi:nitroreductase|tara:strand:- start:1129 stop:1734 length:606 start_codon:yes stop_codon:yes gene_type:complete